MTLDALKEFVQQIVSQAKELKDRHTEERGAPVNYACIFCHSQSEYDELLRLVGTFGKVVKETAAGPVFHIEPIKTVAGPLRLLKIRKPDAEHPELGDADFTLSDYPLFKAKVLLQPGYKLLTRPEMEMIEFVESGASQPVGRQVRCYFSHPPLDEQLLKE